MDLKAQRAAAIKAAQDIINGAAGRDLTDAERTEVAAKAAEVEGLTARIADAEKSASLIDQIAGFAGDPSMISGAAKDGFGAEVDDSGYEAGLSFGERYTASKNYGAFQKAHPSGVGQGSLVDLGKVKVGTLAEWYARQAEGKASVIGTPTARIQPARYPTVNMVDRDRLTLLDLITRGNAAGAFEYLQIISVTRNAAIVPESTDDTSAESLKPISEFATQLADAKPYTYADGYTVTNQMLSDAPALATFLNTEVGYSLEAVIVDKLLNGTGLNGEPRGILNTTGLQELPYTAVGGDVMPLVRAVRRAITNVTRLPGGTVTAILLSPEDDEALDLMQDDMGRFYGGGPFSSGPGTLWGRPRIADESITTGESLLGDFKQVALLDVEGLAIAAFNQHKDYAQRNLTYVRAEQRAEQVIWRPSRLAHVGPEV